MTDSRLQIEIELAIEDNPNSKSYPLQELDQSYQRSRSNAAKQTRPPCTKRITIPHENLCSPLHRP
ncbi:MAG TPA: hypothetical protein PK820_07765 [Candidatus Competibacteraceae bacterium]|nr:hypothetical protein [Candidatus Competibacteraceae bacterium]